MSKKNIHFLDLKHQHKSFKKEIMKAIEEVVDSSQFILGSYVKKFEEEFKKVCGSKYVLGLNSCTDALFLSLKALGISPGDEIITPVYTFVATVDVIIRAGAKPVFVDINVDSFNIDIKKIEEAITKRTKAIIPVHLYGLSADMKPIMKIAKKYNLYVIEDCAQSILAKYNGKFCGTIGITGGFSFYPTKNLGAMGDGGVLITDNDDVANLVYKYRDHGKSEGYYFDVIGYNSRLDAIQAAILKIKLKHLKDWVDGRIRNAHLYNKLFKGTSIKTPIESGKYSHVYNLYTIQVEKRDELKEYLSKKGIQTAIYYPIGNHLQKCFSYLGYKDGDFPVCEKITKKVLSLPVYNGLKKDEIEYITKTILKFYK